MSLLIEVLEEDNGLNPLSGNAPRNLFFNSFFFFLLFFVGNISATSHSIKKKYILLPVQFDHHPLSQVDRVGSTTDTHKLTS